MRHSNILKDDVTKIIENQSIQYNAISKENNRLKSKAEDLLQEMNKVEDKIETDIKKELSICTKELEGLSYSLKEVNLFLKILKQLLEIDFIVKEAKKKIQNHEYYECAILIKNAQNSIKMNSEKLEKIEVFKILSQEVTLTYEHLMHKISEIWSNCVKISVNNDLGENMNVSKITLTVHTQKLNDIAQILKASCQLNLNINEKKFSYKLLNDMLNKIINHKTNLKLNVEEKQAVLSVEIVNTKEKPNYLEVFEKVKVAIEFLKSHLDIEIEENKKFLPLMGSFIAKDFADNLIKNVLSETIPSSSEDLDNYKNVISNAEEFEKSLQSIGFLPGNSNSLIDYARNINTLFSNKFCQSFLNKARIIMKKDLHNITMSEEVISNVNALHTSYKNVLKIKMNIEEDVFLFPKCQIRLVI